MPDTLRHVALAGATGLVGGEVLELLLCDPDVEKVITLGRRPTGRQHPRLVELVAAIDDLEAAPVPSPVDAVLCCLGTTMRDAGSRDAFRRVDLDGPVALARLARRKRAPCFAMISSIGADRRARSFYLRTKGEAEQAVAALGIPSVVILRPSLLLGERQESRPLERLSGVTLRLLKPLLAGPLRRWRPVHARTVARAMIATAGDPPATGTIVLESEAISGLGDSPAR